MKKSVPEVKVNIKFRFWGGLETVDQISTPGSEITLGETWESFVEKNPLSDEEHAIMRLIFAVQGKDKNEIAKLLESKVNINAAAPIRFLNFEQRSALHYVDSIDMLEYLIETNRRFPGSGVLDLNVQDEKDRTLLMTLAEDPNYNEFTKKLLDLDVDLQLTDADGNTAEAIARQFKNVEMAEWIASLSDGEDEAVTEVIEVTSDVSFSFATGGGNTMFSSGSISSSSSSSTSSTETPSMDCSS